MTYTEQQRAEGIGSLELPSVQIAKGCWVGMTFVNDAKKGGKMVKKIRQGKIEVIKSVTSDNFYFRVVSANGRILCHSQQYGSKAVCLKGVRSMVRMMAEQTSIVTVEGEYYCEI